MVPRLRVFPRASTSVVRLSTTAAAADVVATTTITSSSSVAPPVVVFEPQFDALPQLLVITALCAVCAGYWWNVVIPDRRTALALSKRKGDVKEYLDELKEAAVEGDRPFERWLLADWLQENKSAKPAALPFLKKAKWNSGDNPILVAMGGIMALVIAASLAERVSS